MGIDYYSCDICGEAFPDVVDYGDCMGCDSILCHVCKDKMEEKGYHFDGNGELVECDNCNKPKLDKEKFSTLMYWLTKQQAKYDWSDFLDDIGLSKEDYEIIKAYLKENYDTKTYV